MRRFLVLFAACCFIVAVGIAWRRWPYQAGQLTAASFYGRRFSRPYGMAPAAFDGFIRACNGARIHPYRIAQTIGNHRLSVGYHKRDGVVRYRGQKLDYTAALDLGAGDLTRRQLNRFLESLAQQGFAAWYREGGEWRGREHIHAIYAPLRMKWQLQGQMRLWEKQRRRAKKPKYRWQNRWRRHWI
ncbi:hypothetical protein B1R32_102229 [Abditibacterium utsteinense]|uniref:Uncharacterized protein n=1 Tax=Abditibacterium utsteinense TaxID=1960156 RepID=A0A2S8SWP7_9BACT|nr:hypothetical protein [Abditibacterium utsteinense]PQV65220.1 hypothetical protein B1R32_102229 [Abditibacterium utsteinense]